MTGYLNAIDANSGKLKWQTVPASSEIVNVNSPAVLMNFILLMNALNMD